MLLAAHQDVVPVEAGSEGQWTHPPFSGAVAGGFVWGAARSTTRLADGDPRSGRTAAGSRPPAARTVYLAFGHDEERGGTGAAAMAKLLKQRGSIIGLAVDEGFAVLDGVIGGVNTPVAMIGIAEKGYVSVELTATGSGGHSSMPTNDNAAVRIARAVDRLAAKPFPPRLDGVTGRCSTASRHTRPENARGAGQPLAAGSAGPPQLLASPDAAAASEPRRP